MSDLISGPGWEPRVLGLGMNAAEYLARVGFAELMGNPTAPDDEEDADSIEAARLADHARVMEILLSVEASSLADRNGVRWLRPITWPDRVPGLKTWAGNQTLAKIIASRQKAIRSAAPGEDVPDPEDGRWARGADLFQLRVPMLGSSGIDALSSQDARDRGFSVAELDMPVVQRPALELLAIVGLETVPILSYGRRSCGFVHLGRTWRFEVEARDDGYYHRWGMIREERA